LRELRSSDLIRKKNCVNRKALFLEMLTKYLIICPLIFIAGFIDAVAGGGGLVSLPAYMITGIPVHNCIATNKMSSFMGTSVTTAKYARKGFIPWKIGMVCIPCALAGSSLGAKASLLVPDNILKAILMIIIPLTGIYVITRKGNLETNTVRSDKAALFISAFVAFFIGSYDGFYGPGTGVFLILLLTCFAGMKLTTANGLTKVINLSTNIAALVVFLINGQVLFPLGAVAGLFNIAGNYIGATCFEKNSSKIVKPVMIAVLSIFLIKLILEMLIFD
jgi:uncharacterized membrane protein YfcA